jgi:hypothetical protein
MWRRQDFGFASLTASRKHLTPYPGNRPNVQIGKYSLRPAMLRSNPSWIIQQILSVGISQGNPFYRYEVRSLVKAIRLTGIALSQR